MATFSGTLKVLVDALLEETVDIGTVKHSITFGPQNTLTDGTGADQAKQIFTDQRTLAASASENLDMAGVLANAFGTTLTFTKIRAIIIRAASTNTNNVLVGGHATAALVGWVSDATDVVVVRPGGIFVITAPDATGIAVTATTADMLKIANSSSGSSVVYDIVIIGTV